MKTIFKNFKVIYKKKKNRFVCIFKDKLSVPGLREKKTLRNKKVHETARPYMMMEHVC